MPKVISELRVQLLEDGSVRCSYPQKNLVRAYGLVGLAQAMIEKEQLKDTFKERSDAGKRIARAGPEEARKLGVVGGEGSPGSS